MTPDVFDMAVAGGGPAGLATAIAAARAGCRVVVVEPRRPPIDVACGEGIMPGGVATLERLGVDLDGLGRDFSGVRFIERHRPQGRFSGRPGLGVRRPELHQALVRRAEQLDVDLRWGVKVTGLGDGCLHTDHGLVSAALRVAADGRGSRVRSWAGLETVGSRCQRVGVRRHYRLAPWTDLVEVYWANGAEAYVTPVGPDRVGVALLTGRRPARFDQLLGEFPELEKRLAGAPVASSDRGATGFGARARVVVRHDLAFVGDAAGSLDPISGEGVSLAVAGAETLVRSFVAGRLADYATAIRRRRRLPWLMTGQLLLLAEHPRLRRRVLAALERRPHLMSGFLSVHEGDGGAIGRHGLVGLVLRTLLGSVVAG